MALETGTYISDLVSTNPVGTDTLDKADDHLRLIKSTVQATFPSVIGPIRATNSGGAVTPGFQLQGLNDANSAQGIYRYSADANPTRLILSKSRGATAGAHTVVASADSVGNISFAASDGTNFIEAARIEADVDGTPGTNDMPGRLIFSTTADGASSPSERMRIDAAGNVGIGTTPVVPLDLSGSFIHGATQYIGSNLYFSSGWKYKANGYGAYLQLADGSGVLSLATAGNNAGGAAAAATPTTRLQIDASGNILNVSSGGLGYGTGSGGTVTQATSKATSFTLNKYAGQITLNGAALAANTTVSCTWVNSVLTANDVVVTVITGGASDHNNYDIRIRPAAGAATFSITNRSAGSLSEAVVFNFVVIKSATS